MTRIIILIIMFTSVGLIVSCSSPTAQPIATIQPTTAPTVPTVTTQPTMTAVPAPTSVAATKAPVLPTATTQPTTAPTKSSTQSSSSGAQKLNLDEYFPTGRGRDLTLLGCTGCHSFVPIITGQRPKARWESLRVAHRDTSLSLSDNDYNAIFDYIGENFNNTKPEPKLPDWFLQSQTGTGE